MNDDLLMDSEDEVLWCAFSTIVFNSQVLVQFARAGKMPIVRRTGKGSEKMRRALSGK